MKYIHTLLLLFFIPVCICAQTTGSNYEYGKPTEAEFAMTVCELDPDAELVFLFDHYDFALEASPRGFQQVRTYTRRYKVLKEGGVSVGNVEVNLFGEDLDKLKAVVINRDETGQISKTELKKDMIFKEKVSPSLSKVKASLPNVTVGSIIDVVYTVSTGNVSYIPSIYMQQPYPSLRSEVYVHMPDFFVYYVDFQECMHPMLESISFKNYSANGIRYNERWITGVAVDIPPLKPEPFVWQLDDYYTGMSFELKSVDYSYQPVVLSYTWEDVFKNLKDTDGFGRYLKMANPLKDETDEALAGKTSDREKILAIMDLLSEKIIWDESLSLVASNPKAALKDGKGNSADINFTLMSMLKQAGFECTPVLFNPKHTKQIGKYPSLLNIRFFLISTTIDDNGEKKEVFLDGTNKWNSINVMAPQFLSCDAVRYEKEESERYVDISKATKGYANYSVKATVSEDGTLVTDMISNYSGEESFMANYQYESFDTDEEFFKTVTEGENVRNSTGTIEQGRDLSTIKMKFDLLPDNAGDVIYLKPALVDFIDTDIFPSEKRLLPVDMDFTSTVRFRAVLMLGNNWEVEGLPQNTVFCLGENDMKFSYKAIKGNGMVQIVAEFSRNTTYYTPEQYEELRKFYGEIGNFLEGRISLKKVAD